MTEKQKVVESESKKPVLKNRLKTLAKVGIAAAAVTLGSKVQAAQGSPMRRGYAMPQPEVITQPAPVQQVKVTSVAPERSCRTVEVPRPMFGHGSRGGMMYTMSEHTVRHTTISSVGGHRGRLSTVTGHGRHTSAPHMGGHSTRRGGPTMGGHGRGTGFPGMGRGRGGRGTGSRGGGRQMRPRGRGRGF